ncbi:MAG: hypothetical protein LHW56_01515 [Candidatus Cloacimonetes bacterium]|nr:hypothetical protein [Candidatus Cloacimonadota bacterium]MDY0171565.1 hypothetical protein [Candidatus Cloacimonadaceae bacterium]
MLTKEAAVYLNKEAANLPETLKQLGIWAGKGVRKGYEVANWLIRKPGAGLYRNVAKPAAGAAVAASRGAGNFVYQHPTVGLPLLATGMYAGYKTPGRLRKNLLHTDPNMGFTEYRNSPLFGIPKSPLIGPTTRIEYRNPVARQVAEKYPLYY